MILKVSIDDALFNKFKFKLAINGEVNKIEDIPRKTAELIEKWIRDYVDEISPPPPGPGPEPEPEFPPPEKLLRKCKALKVGQLANIVLRRLLEQGVAPQWEVEEFQKAKGKASQKAYHVPFGMHVSNQFDSPFPLLLDENHIQYDLIAKAPKFLKQPLVIDGEKYYLSAQWFIRNREPMENWIRNRLTEWLDQADESRRDEMIKWIDNF